jgi:hypothetical protein
VYKENTNKICFFIVLPFGSVDETHIINSNNERMGSLIEFLSNGEILNNSLDTTTQELSPVSVLTPNGIELNDARVVLYLISRANLVIEIAYLGVFDLKHNLNKELNDKITKKLLEENKDIQFTSSDSFQVSVSENLKFSFCPVHILFLSVASFLSGRVLFMVIIENEQIKYDVQACLSKLKEYKSLNFLIRLTSLIKSKTLRDFVTELITSKSVDDLAKSLDALERKFPGGCEKGKAVKGLLIFYNHILEMRKLGMAIYGKLKSAEIIPTLLSCKLYLENLNITEISAHFKNNAVTSIDTWVSALQLDKNIIIALRFGTGMVYYITEEVRRHGCVKKDDFIKGMEALAKSSLKLEGRCGRLISIPNLSIMSFPGFEYEKFII